MRDPRWDQIFIPGGKGGIPPPKAGSRHSHLGPVWDCRDPAYIPPDILPGLFNKEAKNC